MDRLLRSRSQKAAADFSHSAKEERSDLEVLESPPAVGREPELAYVETPDFRKFNPALRIGNRGLVQLIGSLVGPAVAVLTLPVAYWIGGVPIDSSAWLLCILAFFILYPGPWPADGFRVDVGRQVLAPWIKTVALLLLIDLISGSLVYFDRLALLLWMTLTPFVQYLALSALPGLLATMVRMHRKERRVVIVGTSNAGLSFANAIENDRIAYARVQAFFDDRAGDRARSFNGVPIIGTCADLASYARSNKIDQIFIALPMSAQPRISGLLESLGDSTASVYFLPDLTAFDLIQPRLDISAGHPIVSVCESPFRGIDEITKRATDIFVSLFSIILLSPVFLAAALAVRLSSSGPIIFRQLRYGLDGSEIEVWKFRSMTVTEDGTTAYEEVVRGDRRVTRVGAFLRKTSLDEIPQLVNVLQGRMSIVGPRPHVKIVNEDLRRRIPGYTLRHKVRPGITGWAQVNGLRGGNDLSQMEKRIAFDLDYLRNWTIWFDFKIMLLTVRLIYKDAKAY